MSEYLGEMDTSFTSNEVIALTGITARQLQWWDEQGLVIPVREGRRRLYSVDDLAEIAVLAQLRKKGFSLQRVRKIMRYLQRELGTRLVETVTDGSEYHLLTDGRRVFLKNSASEIVDVLRNSKQPIMSVCLSDAVAEIHAELRPRRARAERARRKGARKAEAAEFASAVRRAR
jgi:DNA-binding transcriptional MerR regulator